jgi:hypothetical protein
LSKFAQLFKYFVDFVAKSADVAFSDWGSSELSKDQISHASMKVHLSLMIAEELVEHFHLAANAFYF